MDSLFTFTSLSLHFHKDGGRRSIAGIAQHSTPISIKESPFSKIFPLYWVSSIFSKNWTHLQFYMNILLKKLSSFFTGKSHVKFLQNYKLENIFEKSHRSIVILKNPGSTPQLVANFTPIRKLLCTFLYLCYGNPRPPPLKYLRMKKFKEPKMDSHL